MSAACRCWEYVAALGHEGHCCFLRDDRADLKRADAWRADGDICHVPTPTTLPSPGVIPDGSAAGPD